MTSQKEKASGVTFGYYVVLVEHIWNQPSYKVLTYSLHWVYTFGASPVAALPTFTSSGLNSALEDPKSDVALVFLPYSTRSLSIGVNQRE